MDLVPNKQQHKEEEKEMILAEQAGGDSGFGHGSLRRSEIDFFSAGRGDDSGGSGGGGGSREPRAPTSREDNTMVNVSRLSRSTLLRSSMRLIDAYMGILTGFWVVLDRSCGLILCAARRPRWTC